MNLLNLRLGRKILTEVPLRGLKMRGGIRGIACADRIEESANILEYERVCRSVELTVASILGGGIVGAIATRVANRA